MGDKYDEAVEYLTKHPGEIHDAWVMAHGGHAAGCLFAFVMPADADEDEISWKRDVACGCLTQIRAACGSDTVAWTRELTEAIVADRRIPQNPDYITVADLPVFAEWQRRIDRELNRNGD